MNRTFFGQQLKFILLAFSFLSRLGKTELAPEKNFASALFYYPLVGLALGFLSTLPFYLGLFSKFPFLQAALILILLVFLTRALHLDGLADLADALGSNKHGLEFQAILKDSHVGAFGVIALVLLLLVEYATLSYLCLAKNYLAIIWVFAFSRSLIAPLAVFNKPADCSVLGKIVCNEVELAHVITATLFSLLLGLFMVGLVSVLATMFLSCFLLLALSMLANQRRGD